MALFKTYRNPNTQWQPQRTRQRPAAFAFPQELRRLRRVCSERHTHSLPVEMVQLNETLSNHGTPMLVMACPFRNCNYREGWVIDFQTGRPRKLWGGTHNGR